MGRWWLFRASRAEIDEALGESCRMALAGLTLLPGGYEVRTSVDTLSLVITRRGPAFELVFHGPWRSAKKGVLLAKLIRKQFEPVVPRLRIRLRPRS